MPTENPFFAPSDLPCQLPPFEHIRDEHYLPAFEHGMAEQRAEIEQIATDTEPPTVDNTLVALERSGRVLARVSAAFFNMASADTNPQIQQIEADIAPRLAAHSDAIYLDGRLYARVRTLYEARDSLAVDDETRWLLERYHTDFVRAGARLTGPEQERLRELNAELATLCTGFGTKLLADTNDLAVVVDDGAELDGLPDDALAAAAEAAKARGLDGKYLITLILPTDQPALASLRNRDLRERIHRAAIVRGARGNANDTTADLLRIVRLRAERARLLGYPHHAAYVIEDNTARTAQAVETTLAKLAPTAAANADAEAADLQAQIGDAFRLEPWDWSFYADRVRKERYDIDDAELRPYLELDRVLHDGVFFAANQLFGIRFEERPDLRGYHPDVRVFEVLEPDGRTLGLFLADLYTRDSKRGGAWANALVSQSHLLGTVPVVANNLNVNRPPAGEPTLLTPDETRTLFHEFGHALHVLFSDVRYPRFAGTRVPRDFVEYPSQVNEVWMFWPEVLANYATHYRTGEPLPAALADRLRSAEQFNQGFTTTEYLAATLLDLAWHVLTPEDADAVDDVYRFEADALAKAGVATPYVLPRYRSSYFAHIFSGIAYSAAYYSYIWSEILDADTVAWLTENGGLRRENGERLRTELLSRGGSADAMSFFRGFRGRDPEIEPLLKRRNLAQR